MIELAEPVSAVALIGGFGALMRGLSTRFEQLRHGYFGVTAPVQRLGRETSTAQNAQKVDDHRPFLVHLMGPGIGDAGVFEVEAVLGFTPTHAVKVSAGCNREIDHAATALLTAAVVDVLGDVVKAELLRGQEAVVAGQPSDRSRKSAGPTSYSGSGSGGLAVGGEGLVGAGVLGRG
ncbi:hypothetical protein GCM10009639_35070 [Kitasatospora putterlickiae]|uniref:Uncharacterized protein n=1 Tax=Kitasatospora putterlickiae TaxID=221725 RepID=A0ABP4IWQ7_9ACTN